MAFGYAGFEMQMRRKSAFAVKKCVASVVAVRVVVDCFCSEFFEGFLIHVFHTTWVYLHLFGNA